MEQNNTIEIPIIDKDDYYKDTEYVSFSHIKLFDQCETLYRDTYVTKEYEEGDKDYFTYGKLVDAMLSESDEYIRENFVRVERKIKIEDALKYENQIKELEAYIKDPAFLEKIAKGNKTAEKGLEKRTREIEEAKEALKVIANCADKVQVTPSIWNEAEETALALKTHPSFRALEWNQITSQQIIKAEINGIKKKGRLDHLKLSPAISKLYAIYVAGQITKDELQNKIKALNHNDWWAIITDIKTCYSLEKLEPYSEHYMGQLTYYQELVSDFFCIPRHNIKVRILAGDKTSNNFKMSELFTYPQEELDTRLPQLHALCVKLVEARASGKFVSEKEKKGLDQKCFKCTECRFCPFSNNPGEPVLITKPRFGKNAPIEITGVEIVQNDIDVSGLY